MIKLKKLREPENKIRDEGKGEDEGRKILQ